MLPLVFVGGAITGAAGLLAAALWDKHRTDSQYSPALKSPETLDATGAAEQLNSYFFKAQALYSKCNEIVFSAIGLISTPIPLPDDNIFQKAGVFLGGKANKWCRNWRQRQLNEVREEAETLFDRYKGVFKRANELVAQKAGQSVDLSAIKFAGNDRQIDSSLENDNWDGEFEEFADTIREFIESSCNVVLHT